MRQFIKNNRPYAQTSREDFAQKYLSEGCEEVSVLYNGNFVDPIWNGTTFMEGATPEEIAEANKPIVPIQVKNMKFRLALIKSGIMPSSIDTAITQMPEGAMKENIFTLWNFADYLERNDVSLNYMAGQFNITHEQLDNLFILSDTL